MKTNLIKISVVAVLILLGVNGFAQKGFNLTVNGTIQDAMMLNSDDMDDENQEIQLLVLPSFGIGGGYNFNDGMGIGLEANYSMQGHSVEYLDIKSTTRLDYIRIPVFFHYNTSSEKNVMFSANVGPQMGILVDSKLLDEDGEEILDDLSDVYMDITFGGFVSIGAEYKLCDHINLFGMLKADMDLTNAEDDEYNNYPADRSKTFNTTIGVKIGARYNF